MREILFRGQTRRYGEKVRMGDGQKLPSRWVYGGVLQGAGDHSIIYGGEDENDPADGLNKWVVYTDTLGQFTGMTDKNGKKVFEGDILEFNSRIVNIASGLPTGGNCTERSVVEWGGHRWNRKRIYHSQWNSNWRNYGFTTDLYPENAAKYAEIIGNIHDNPELLEGEDGN